MTLLSVYKGNFNIKGFNSDENLLNNYLNEIYAIDSDLANLLRDMLKFKDRNFIQ